MGKQVPARSTCTVYLDHGLPIAFCDVTDKRLEFGDWMHKGKEDICSLEFDRLEEDAKKGWDLIEYPADLKSDLPEYRPCIALRARADGTVDSGRAVNAALAFRTKSGSALGVCCKKFGLHMSEQRLGQIHKQYAVPDPCREEIDHSLTEKLTRVAGQRLCDTWKAHGRPPPRGMGARAVILQLKAEYPKWKACGQSAVNSQAAVRYAQGISPPKREDRGKKRYLSDAAEFQFRELAIEMDAVRNQPSIADMQDQLQRHLAGTVEGGKFKDTDRPSKGFVQMMVRRGLLRGQLDMDTTIQDKDQRIEWEHFENYLEYFDRVIETQKRMNNWIPFDNYDPEEVLGQPGRIKDSSRNLYMDESKLKLEQKSQPGRAAKRIVPAKKGPAHRKAEKAAGNKVLAQKASTRVNAQSLSNTIVHTVNGAAHAGPCMVIYMAEKVKPAWKDGGPVVEFGGKKIGTVWRANTGG